MDWDRIAGAFRKVVGYIKDAGKGGRKPAQIRLPRGSAPSFGGGPFARVPAPAYGRRRAR